MTRRRLLCTSGPILVVLIVGLAPAVAQTAGAELSTRMGALVAGLDEDQSEQASYAFDDEERFDLKLAPVLLEGLRRDAMNDAQTEALDHALRSVLSPSGRVVEGLGLRVVHRVAAQPLEKDRGELEIEALVVVERVARLLPLVLVEALDEGSHARGELRSCGLRHGGGGVEEEGHENRT